MRKRRQLLRIARMLLALLFLPAIAISAEVPRTLDELWAVFPALDQTTPLESEVLIRKSLVQEKADQRPG